MKLEQLSVQDFKSYRGKHSFGPFDNFSAIIGENGTGKSNLFDALCFVLGANANVMRCQQLTNLIWNGSPNPICAKVTLKLRLSENDPIVIKRKIMSNGNSHYYINKSKKSATEYRSSMIEFGFPSKLQSYVIFQGDIQQIASMKPIELTSMIEELSGSIQFKESYEKSELEYNEKQEEVSQLDEKREYLANQRRNMKKEAQETAEWKQLEEKMLQLQKELANFQMYQSVQNYKISQAKLTEIESDIDNKRRTITDITEAIDTTDKTIDTAQKCHKKAVKELRKSERIFEAEKNQINILQTKKEEIDKELKKIKVQICKTKQEIGNENRLKLQHQQVIFQLTEKNQLIIQNQDEIKRIEDKLNEIDSNCQEYQLKAEIEELTTQIELEKEKKNQFCNQIATIEQELSKIEEKSNSIEHIDCPNDPINNQNEIQKLTKKLNHFKEDLYKIQKLCYRNKKIERLSNAIHVLQQSIPNVYGFVRDLCRPVRSKYEIAYSSALTYHLDEVIVKDRETAKKCIEMCKTKNLGQITFLPLNSLHHLQTDNDEAANNEMPRPQKSKRSVKMNSNLIDLLEFEERDRAAIEFVTCEIYFCENPDDALHLYKKGIHRKIVDINGTVYYKKGMLTGGSKSQYHNTKQSPDFIKNEIQQIEDQIEQLTEQQNDEIELYQQHLKKFTEYRHQIELIEMNKIESVNTLLNLNDNLQKTTSIIEKLEVEFQEKSNQYQSKVKSQYSKMKKELNKLPILKVFQLKNVDQLILIFKEYQQDQISIQNAERELAFLEDSILAQKQGQLKQQQKEFKQQLNQITQQITDIKNQHENDHVKSCQEKVDKYATDVKQAKNEKSQLIQRKNSLIKELNKIESMIIDNKNILVNTKEELEMLLTRFNEDFDEILEKDFSSILSENLLQLKSNQQRNSIENSFKTKINKIQEELDLKQPNFKADQTFLELKEKVHKIDSQLQNVRKEMLEKGQLYRSIKKQRHSMFMKTFDLLVNSIQSNYAKLTRTPQQPLGGTAFLTPIQPQCPFLDGITYSVLPPLKRLRSINALSGGEQTLAVISLIFALNEARPAPCLIFDEIDAALDKRNMAMLSTFLKSESESKQIIIVSHRDRLYCEADSLIGVAKDIKNQTSCTFIFKLSQIIQNEEENKENSYEEPETFMTF